MPKRDWGVLSDREKQILQCYAQGMNQTTIQATLFISYHTVKTHCKHIHQILQTKTMAHAVAIGYQQGILPHSSDTPS